MDKKEAIEIVREYYPSSGKDLNEALETLIPELKESEDERIRQDIITTLSIGVSCKESALHPGAHTTLKEAISWLEKQGEHIKFLQSIQIGDEVTRNPDGVLVNLSQLKRKAEQGSQNLANSAKTCKDEQNPVWSEEDEQYLLVCKNALAKYQTTDKWDAGIISHWLEDWLKSLKERYTWKPSDEQMDALSIIKDAGNSHQHEVLDSLYYDLKKLKE